MLFHYNFHGSFYKNGIHQRGHVGDSQLAVAVQVALLVDSDGLITPND